MARMVRFRVLDGIGVVTLEAPPVNALSAGVRGSLWQVFSRINQSDDVRAVVLMAAGRMFSAGAEINEYAGPVSAPSLGQLCAHIEDTRKPVVAALHGQALGGGAELALAAHYRLALADARIGLPEVTLGLIPGAGGTQRLPRLVGAERAMQMMVSTQSIDGAVAQQIGLVDGIIDGDLGSGAVAFAQGLVARGEGPRPTRANRRRMADGRSYLRAVAKARAALEGNPLHAPKRVVDCVEAAGMLPFDAGLAFEEDAFEQCLTDPQSVALRHVFQAERRIDEALIERDGAAFNPVEPMGKSVVLRLRKALRAAGDVLVADGATEAEIDAAMVAYGFRRGPFGGREGGATASDISRKLVAALLVEGCACVDEQAVQRPSDIDALAVHGLGFPRRKGGPMRAMQSAGLIDLRSDLRRWAEVSDLWAPPDLLDEAIKDARGFDALG